MNGNNNNKKPGMGNQNPSERKDTGRNGDMNKGGDNRPKGTDYNGKKPSTPGNPSGSYRPDIRSGNNGSDKMKGDKCHSCGNHKSKCSC